MSAVRQVSTARIPNEPDQTQRSESNRIDHTFWLRQVPTT